MVYRPAVMFKTRCAFSVLQHGLIVHISYRVRRGHQDVFQQVTDFCVLLCCHFPACPAALREMVLPVVDTGARTSTLGGVAPSFLHDKHLCRATGYLREGSGDYVTAVGKDGTVPWQS